jgi:serine/threonine protein kinase
MASVFLAVQESLGRQVALKVLAPAFAAQRGFTSRFLNEGRIIAYLKHPLIVNVYDLGSYGHDYYLSMELLPAGTLEQRIKEGIGVVQSVGIIKHIATALGFAHQQGVIHRDIKPQNILFRDDGLPVLTDFGIARLINDGPHLTIPGRTLGSPLYMSPEQINGHKIDARADLYALGIVLYKLLTRKLPYESDQIMAVALMHKTEPIPILPDHLLLFQPVLNQLLAKAPNDRFSSAQELIDALVQIESKFALPEHGTDRRVNGCQPPVQKQPDSGRVCLLDTSPIHTLDALSRHALEPTMAASENQRNETVQDQEGLGTVTTNPAIRSRVAVTASKDRSAMKKAAFLSASALAVGLSVALLWLALFSGSPQPSPRAASATQGDKFLESHQVLAGSNPRQSEKMPLSPRQGDRSAMDSKVGELLARAHEQLARYRLTSPTGDNCYETYRQIVALDPASQAAQSIKNSIGEAYRRLALGAKTRGRLKQGLLYADKGLKVQPEDPMLLALQVELRSGIAEQIGIKIERPERQRAVEQAEIEEVREAEQALAERNSKEAELIQLERQRAEQEVKEQPKPKVVIEQPETTGKDPDKHSRLFGTF